MYRIAGELSLAGWIRNTPSGVTIEVQGSEDTLQLFVEKLRSQLPAAAFLNSLSLETVPAQEESSFVIKSSGSGRATALMMPDMATCDDCLAELFDKGNRRYHYPFTNCTNCGPRYSIIHSLPYDRANTSMAGFKMCPECQDEYDDPGNRRFHAQPNACPVCGPVVSLREANGKILCYAGEALDRACSLILKGGIAAVKGLGGFHLLARADSDQAVSRLRELKKRPFKPLAVMIPDTAKLTSSEGILSLLRSPAAPIVLVKKEEAEQLELSDLISPGIGTYGLMVPYTPLHHVMMHRMGIPVVATSGNRASEPICISFQQARERLCGIADIYLDHDRPILRPVDDSVLVVSDEGVTPFRRSRGYAPLPLPLQGITPGIVSLGANERNTVGVSVADAVMVSQHIGDMSDAGCLENACSTVKDIMRIYGVEKRTEVVDMHPDYAVREIVTGEPFEVQHHYAHVLSCMAENRLKPPVFGIVWDGSGYGSDGTIWGGEFISVADNGKWSRSCHFRRFPLPGGEQAIKKPPRTASGMLFEAGIEDLTIIPGISGELARNLVFMMQKGVNSPLTSSVGRLFDGLSALLGVCSLNSYSGQAAVELQSIAREAERYYPVSVSGGTIDWVPVLLMILDNMKSGAGSDRIAGRFHMWLAESALTAAGLAGTDTVVLSGGCFQNTLLLDLTARLLRENGFQVYSHHVVPPGDGGLSLGQAAAAMHGGEECV